MEAVKATVHVGGWEKATGHDWFGARCSVLRCCCHWWGHVLCLQHLGCENVKVSAQCPLGPCGMKMRTGSNTLGCVEYCWMIRICWSRWFEKKFTFSVPLSPWGDRVESMGNDKCLGYLNSLNSLSCSLKTSKFDTAAKVSPRLASIRWQGGMPIGSSERNVKDHKFHRFMMIHDLDKSWRYVQLIYTSFH